MKAFICVLFIAAVAVAEPPQYRFKFSRREVEGEKEPTTAKSDEAPYPAAGYRPATEFRLPNREEVAPPATSYGIPYTSYGPPAVEYGPPESSASEEPKEEPEKKESDENLPVEGLKKEKLEEDPKSENEVINNQGAYYVLLPGAQLQRVQFQTENDLRNMAYTARLQYRAEDRAPLYVYSAVPQYQPSAAYIQLF